MTEGQVLCHPMQYECGELNGGINGGINEGVNEGVSAIGKSAKETYSLICSNPGINTPLLVSMSGKSDATIERHIALLKKEKVIEHRGSDKTGGCYPIGTK